MAAPRAPVMPAAATQRPASAGFASNRLLHAPVHPVGGRAVVPLLTPAQHGLPFALTLELHAEPAARSAAAAADAAAPADAPPGKADTSLYALHYILAGSGRLVRSKAKDTEQLAAGDAVLMHDGAARVAAPGGSGGGSADEAASAAGAAAGSGAAAGPYAMAELVAYMPQELFVDPERRRQQQQQQQASEEQADGAQPQGAACDLGAVNASLAALQRELGGQQPSAGAEQRLSPEVVDVLLAGAQDAARLAMQQEQQGPASADARRQQQQHWLPRLVQAAADEATAWWQAQQGRTCPVTKRTLGELTAFQLPNQTNRLAVQFDPFSQPRVPFISGIEVFEAGHRTTPHVHPTAHELFFILAGAGTGFCGDQRFPVSAGDVVVFRPGAEHGIDNGDGGRMYCLELMVPNEEFAEYVRGGTDTGRLGAEDMCVLRPLGCR